MVFWKTKKKQPIKIRVQRGGEDYEWVTLHINDWYALLKALKADGPITMDWKGVKGNEH